MIEKTRNIGIIAHIDAGKTTTTERILYYTRKIHRIGEVDDGTTTTDWYAEERKRGISIFSAATTCMWKGYKINVIDTPGHVDFTAEVERSLRVLDGAIGVFCGVGGVEAQSETVWKQANRYKVPRIAYVNKLDRTGSNFARVVEQMRNKLGANTLPLTMPYGSENNFSGVIDLVKMKLVVFEGDDGSQVVEKEIPNEATSEANKAHEKLIEQASEFDDELMKKFLADAAVFESELKPAIRKGTIACKIIPVLCGSSLHNIGVQLLLDAVCDYMPAPIDVPPIEGHEPDSENPTTRKPEADAYFSGLAFKTETDRHGELTYLRIYSGALRSGESVYNPRIKKTERITRLFQMHSHDRIQIDQALPGDIAAVIGLKETVTGDTLCDKRHPIILEKMKFPQTVISMAIEPKSSADKDRLMDVLVKLAKDDPTFKSYEDKETGQTIISGMGELHLDILKTRILNDFGVGANVGEPRVAYKETILNEAQAEDYAEIRSGDKILFGNCKIVLRTNTDAIEPTVRFELTEEKAKLIRKFTPAIEDGIKGALLSGPIAGFPMIYLDAIVLGADVKADSNELAYAAAGTNAVRKALAQTKCALLEPHMRFSIAVPEEYMGDIINDLNRRGAGINEVEQHETTKVIKGNVSFAKMFGYATTMRSITQGRGSYILEPYDYKQVPDHEVKKLFGEFV